MSTHVGIGGAGYTSTNCFVCLSIFLLILVENIFPELASPDYSFPSISYSQSLPTSPPIRIHSLSDFSLGSKQAPK